MPENFLLRCKVSELVRRLRTVDVVRVNMVVVMVCARETKGVGGQLTTLAKSFSRHLM